MKGYICIHGHFYQPPRENPWLERIVIQDSAFPYHDWNARVHAECYAPNAVSRILDSGGKINTIVNNYEDISFNFGPTLLNWMEDHSPDIYKKIIRADRLSVKRRNGHGNAIAQAYNHMIMPLANRRDKVTQIHWGIRSFEKHFGRLPEGMWLPETAVDIETLEILSDHGIKFTLLAPRQARRVRPVKSLHWQDVSDGSIDTTRPYLARLPSGSTMALFFYNGDIAHDVAFGGMLAKGDAFEGRLVGALPPDSKTPRLVNVATDGETYGHHHRFGDMALSYVLDRITHNPEVQLTNYGEYLSLHPPNHLVTIIDNSSWSCVHGVERWRADCGCKAGGHGDWNQRWRATLRETLDWLRYKLIAIYKDHAAPLLKDPWQARDDYIRVVADRTAQTREAFLADHVVRNLTPAERIRVFQLLEMQRNAMLMYTSCGWFFDEVSGIEAVQVLCYAARAIELAEKITRQLIENEFTERLKEAQSNISDMGSGADIYRKFALPAKTGLRDVAIHFAISSFIDRNDRKNILGAYTIELTEYDRHSNANAVAAVGMVRVRSVITEEEASFVFAALRQELHDYHCVVRACDRSGEAAEDDGDLFPRQSYGELVDSLFASLKEEGAGSALTVIEHHLGKDRHTIKDLFKDEREELLNVELQSELEYVGVTMEEIYRKTSFLTTLLTECGHRVPTPFTLAAEVALKRKLVAELDDPASTADSMGKLLDEIKRWNISLDNEWIKLTLRQRLEREMRLLQASPETENLRQVNGLLAKMYLFPIQEINLWQAQNIFFELLSTSYQANKEAAEEGDEEAIRWLAEFGRLGMGLLINVDNVAAGLQAAREKETKEE